MDVKSGHKNTEAGIIPEDWEVVEIGDLNPFVTSGSRGWAAFYSDQGSPFIRITNLSRTCIYLDLKNLRFVTLPGTNREATRTQLKDGDVLISITADIGIVGHVTAKIPKPAYINQHIALIRFDPLQTNSKFISYFLAAEKPQKTFRALTDSGAKAGMNLTTVQRIRLALPPTKAEQEAIAEALSDADALIESLEQLIAKKRNIKKGAMQELLRPKKGWGLKNLEDIADVIDPHPSHRAPFEVPNGIPFVGIGDLDENGELLGSKVRRVAPSVFDEHLTRYDLRDELIGLGRVASIGKVVKLKNPGEKYVVSPTLGVIRGTKVRRDYLFYALKSNAVADQFSKIMSGSTRSSVGMIVLRKLDIPLPPDEVEQSAIASTLSDMGAEIAALEAKLTKARQIKQGMMQELLTGRIRLV